MCTQRTLLVFLRTRYTLFTGTRYTLFIGTTGDTLFIGTRYTLSLVYIGFIYLHVQIAAFYRLIYFFTCLHTD